MEREAAATTRALAAHLASFAFEALPPAVVHEARRGILDWIGCALAGARHPTLDKLNAVLSEAGGKPVATVFGRGARLGLLDAPLVNGQAGHVLDFDDTHMGALLHTSSPTLAALFALADRGGADGRAFISAYVAGFEAGVRVGQAAPRQHDGGWHLTGTLGAIAAGAAAGKLLGLDALQMTHALGIAATQSAGMQQNRGTMCKSFHAGKAASSGVLAALLAREGFDSSHEILEGPKGFCRIYSTVAQPEALTEGSGNRWLISGNGHKPYACGVVLHPAIDAMIALGADASSVKTSPQEKRADQTRAKKMWTVRAGQGGRNFDEFRTRSIVAVGWEAMGDTSGLQTREGLPRNAVSALRLSILTPRVATFACAKSPAVETREDSLFWRAGASTPRRLGQSVSTSVDF
jgi:2-methylcitrate dehydratase PrpD